MKCQSHRASFWFKHVVTNYRKLKINGRMYVCQNHWKPIIWIKSLNGNFMFCWPCILVIILDSDQLEAHLLYFAICLLQSATCFEHQEVELYWCSIWYHPLSQWPSGAQVEREQFSLSLCTGWPLTERMILDAASVQFNLLMMSI